MPTEPLDWDQYIADFRRAGHEAVDWIAEYLSHTRDHSVLPDVKPGALVDLLPKSAPDDGESFDAILRDFEKQILPAVTHWNHPRFMAFFACTGSTPAILGEMLSAALNTNGLYWKTSPALAELEQVTLRWLGDWIGVPKDWFGIVYDTASVSSFHAICAAREMVDPESRVNGSSPNLVLYTSEQSHSSIEKGAIAAGIGQKHVRKVATDPEFRMRPDALAALIEQDLRNGLRPFCVVATVGTTSSTSIDPVSAIADVCEKNGLWLHVDAAYAGSAAILPEFQWILEGLDRAHSLVVNPHKWLMTPIDLSAFYTKRPDILKRAFSLVPEYLKAADDPRAINLMDYGVPLGHRFRSLKLWFMMRYFGRDRLQQILRQHIAWAKRLAEEIAEDPRFEVIAAVPFSTVCFAFKGSDDDNRAILDQVNASGQAYISHTSLNGMVVLRVAIGNLGTTWDDVAAVWKLVREAADNFA